MTISTSALVPVRVLHDFAGSMEFLKIPYMLTGSMAMFQYSVYRMTAYIDIVVELQPLHGKILIENLEPDYYVPHNSMMRAISSERMFNVIHQETSFKVDCVLRKSTPFQITAFERRQRLDFHGTEVDTITLEDLILSKLLWAKDSKSEKQLTDVKNLIRNPLDRKYIELWANEIDVRETYDECRREIGI